MLDIVLVRGLVSTMAQTPSLTISADEINCLIHSYLEDSGNSVQSYIYRVLHSKKGMQHTAFSLLKEGQLENKVARHHIPRGELVELLGKALLYLEVEAHFKGDEAATTCKTGFSLLQRHICSPNPPAPQNDSSVILMQTNGISGKRQPDPSSSGRDTKRVRLDQEPEHSEPEKSKKKPSDKDHILTLPGHKTEVIMFTKKTFSTLLLSQIFVCAFNPSRPSLLASGCVNSCFVNVSLIL